MSPSWDLSGQVALVTGSRRGIGEAIARALATQGVAIAVHGRAADGPSADQGARVCTAIEAEGGRAVSFSGDIASKAAVTDLAAAVLDAFGRLDILVLNAARAPFKDSARLLERDLRALVEVNLLGNHYCVQKTLPALRAQRGRIVFVSSLGSRFMNQQYPLGPMKAAMEAQVRQWAEEFRADGIRANAVCAGLVKTDAYKTLRRLWPELAHLPEALFVPAEEVASAVQFFASPASAGVTGQTLVVDRGLSNRLMRGP